MATLLGIAGLIANFEARAESPCAGTFAVEGVNPDGTRYGGRVQLRAVDRQGCRADWAVTGQTWRGEGLWQDEAIALRWSDGGQLAGLALVQPARAGRRQVLWQIDGQRLLGSETWTAEP